MNFGDSGTTSSFIEIIINFKTESVYMTSQMSDKPEVPSPIGINKKHFQIPRS
jgi:hypothetical protein